MFASFKKMSLKRKLILVCLALTIVPIAVVGGFSIVQVDQLGTNTSEQAYTSLEEQAKTILNTGVAADRERVSALIDKAEGDARQLAGSANMVGYLTAKQGKNELLNDLAQEELFKIAEGVMLSCEAQTAVADPEKIEAARQAVGAAALEIEIGESGYVFVMDSDANTLVHPKPDMVGTNLITDHGLSLFEEVLDKHAAGETRLLNYEFEGRQKCIAYTYYPEWDWIICASAYWDDLSAEAATASLGMLKQDAVAFHNASSIELGGGEQSLYRQIRYVDAEGQEVFNVVEGELSESAVSRAGAEWFTRARGLAPGAVYNAGVAINPITQGIEMCVASPVYAGGEFCGVFALNLDWEHAWALLEGHTYGETGYAFIVNEEGVLVSHPQYSFRDGKNVATGQGRLAEIVRGQMLAGQTGVQTYAFEGEDKYMAYQPLAVGDKTYSIAGSCPVHEFLHTANEIKTNAETRTASVIWIVGVVAAVLGVLGGLVGLFVSLGVSRPVMRIIAGLTSGAEQTASAAGQVSSASQSLAEGASEQAASIEETTSSVEEMTSMIKQNAANAGECKTLADTAQENADRGAEAMGKMSGAIDDIKKSSDETAKIIKTIDEIAFQTNLLALNAAVEAARAGEAGKGFAVVAEEVRNLAQRSAEAAKNTAGMIEESVKNADNGVQITKQVAEVLDQIATGNRKVNDLVAEIAGASNEQSQGIEQINTAVGQMDQVTQSSAANAEESASAAEELSAQAEELNTMVQELQAIVGGAASVKKDASRKATPAHKLHFRADDQAKTGPKAQPGGSKGKSKTQAAAPKPTRESHSSAEQEIPLDDGDSELAEF